jgi:hypothetical protein
MKKIIVGLTLLLGLASFTFARNKEEVNPETLRNFKKEFKSAQNVSWAVADEIATASFSLNGFRVQAYYGDDGQLLGTARTILFEQLPINVINAVNNRYGTAPLYEIIEFTRGAETFYRMTVETAKNKQLIQLSTGGTISVEKKTKK